MTVPNLITLLRLVMVPIIIWAMLDGALLAAFILFLVAGFSDAVDGAIARYFDQQSELGMILDPLADKVMLVSVFLLLGYLGHLPIWLTILVISRDILIVAGILICSLLGKPVSMRPIWISKANTVAQIALACLTLGLLAAGETWPFIQSVLVWITATLTALSAGAYVVQGIRHLSSEASAIRGPS